MDLATLRNWFGAGRSSEAPGAGAVPAGAPADSTPAAMPPAPRAREPAWTPARIALADALWGEGFISPGGAEEVMRLARPLGLTGASTVLLLGIGSGGPLRTLAGELGAWVDGFTADADLAAIGTKRAGKAGLGKRARIERWDPAAPEFRPSYVRHALALEPVGAARPEVVIPALLSALKSDGQLAMTELVSGVPPDGPLLARWASMERRPCELPSESTITGLFTSLSYDVPVVEDVSAQHVRLALDGWHRLLHELRANRPAPAHAQLLVGEAERWLLRLQLIRAGTLRMVRWHAIGRG